MPPARAAAEEPRLPARVALVRLWRYARPRTWRLAAGMGSIVLAVAGQALLQWLLKMSVDRLAETRSTGGLAAMVAGIVAVAALVAGLRVGGRLLVFNAGRSVEYSVRNDLFAALLRLDRPFFDAHPTGDLMSRATGDLMRVRALVSAGIYNLTNTAVTWVVAVAFMLRLDAWLTMIALAPLPLVALLANRIGRRLWMLQAEVQERLADISTRAQEGVSGIAVVRAHGREEGQVSAFGLASAAYRDAALRLNRVDELLHPMMALLGGAGTLAVLWLGGHAVISGRMTLGDFVAFNGLLAMLLWPTLAFGWVLTVFQRGLAALARVLDPIDRARGGAAVVEPSRELRREPLRPAGVELRRLDFDYPDGTPALRGVTAVIPAGSIVAVVGRSGAGKSTLMKCVSGIYAVPRGSVLLGGVDIEDVPRAVLRRRVVSVPQEAFLFSGSIAENIAYGSPRAPRERVVAAGEAAALAEDVARFPGGWDTVVGERGVTLSGGQRQRVTIARALLAGDPDVVLLDDCLSSVDPEAGDRILASLRTWLAGRTAFVVTHRLSIARAADRVLVLDGGCLVEQGTPEELLAAGGPLAALARRQRIERELEAM